MCVCSFYKCVCVFYTHRYEDLQQDRKGVNAQGLLAGAQDGSGKAPSNCALLGGAWMWLWVWVWVWVWVRVGVGVWVRVWVWVWVWVCESMGVGV